MVNTFILKNNRVFPEYGISDLIFLTDEKEAQI